MADKMQIQVLAKAKVLGCPVDAGFVRNGADNTIIVYGKADPMTAKSYTITELLVALGSMVSFGTVTPEALKTQLANQLPEKLSQVMESISFQLKEAYFVTSSRTPVGTAPALKGTTEFAFWFDIILEPGLTAGFPITLDSISIKLWQTKNARILDEMKISDMKKLLESALDLAKEDSPAVPPAPAPEPRK